MGLDVGQETIAFAWDGLTLEGTLHRPLNGAPGPAVLMMQGSGPADRDSNGYFPPIRETFLSRQIATFAFDKPGCGSSSGDWRHYALEERADQAQAALVAMSRHAAVDGDRVGVWGQSQGAWLAQILASRPADLAFAIANSGPSINVELQDLYGCEHTMRAAGHSQSDIDRALALIRDLYDAARRGADYQTVDAEIVGKVRNEPWYGYAAVDDSADWEFACKLIAELYEPQDALSRIRCPFLAIYGGRDLLVPAWQSATQTGRALQDAATTDATVVMFPKADHRIRDSGGEFSAGYLDLLGDWAARRVHP